MSERTERHIERLRKAGGGRLEIRLLASNRERLQALADDASVSRERFINDLIEKAWARLQKKLDTKS